MNSPAQPDHDVALCHAVWHALHDVPDPEIPAVSLVDLGMVHRVTVTAGHASVELLPTFVGCPALDFIKANVTKRVLDVEDVTSASVTYSTEAPWSSERITDDGIKKLRQYGIAHVNAADDTDMPACPYCGRHDAHIENLFGPTPCRMVYYCNACRQPFEAMKRTKRRNITHG